MLHKSIYLILFTLITLTFTSCKTYQISSLDNPVELPSSYPGVSDTANIAKLKIDEVILDSQLIALIQIAINNNQDVLIALQRINAARANFQQNRLALLPSLLLETSAGVTRYADHTIDGV